MIYSPHLKNGNWKIITKPIPVCLRDRTDNSQIVSGDRLLYQSWYQVGSFHYGPVKKNFMTYYGLFRIHRLFTQESFHSKKPTIQFVVFKPLNYYFEETIGFDVKVSFARPPVPRLIKTGDITK